jgi:hypothetical protein
VRIILKVTLLPLLIPQLIIIRASIIANHLPTSTYQSKLLASNANRDQLQKEPAFDAKIYNFLFYNYFTMAEPEILSEFSDFKLNQTTSGQS